MSPRDGLVPAGPVDSPPNPLPFPTRDDWRAQLAHVLRDVDLGLYDKRIGGWLIGLDAPTIATLTSWVERARAAERAAILRDLNHEIDICRTMFNAIAPAERGNRSFEDGHRAGLASGRSVVVDGPTTLLYVRGWQLAAGDVLDGRAYPDQPESMQNRETVLSVTTATVDDAAVMRVEVAPDVFRVFDADAEILIWREVRS